MTRLLNQPEDDSAAESARGRAVARVRLRVIHGVDHLDSPGPTTTAPSLDRDRPPAHRHPAAHRPPGRSPPPGGPTARRPVRRLSRDGPVGRPAGPAPSATGRPPPAPRRGRGAAPPPPGGSPRAGRRPAG